MAEGRLRHSPRRHRQSDYDENVLNIHRSVGAETINIFVTGDQEGEGRGGNGVRA